MASPHTQIITEITPLSDKDCFYLVDRYKERFTYPIHRHDDYELNFISDASDAVRVVGDSINTISDLDLVLVGNGIEHAWEQGSCLSGKIHEITIQFSKNLFGDTFMGKTQMAPIRDMLEKASHGIAFSRLAIMRVYHLIEQMTTVSNDFYRVLILMRMLYELATCDTYKILSSSSFAKIPQRTDSRRVLKVQAYIDTHYKEDIRLPDLAAIVGMTATSFSRFFKLRTGRHISEYIIDVRLGHATRMLVDSTHSVAEICYDCGFNNVSYFNRIFKKRKGCSPTEFREMYKRNRVIV